MEKEKKQIIEEIINNSNFVEKKPSQDERSNKEQGEGKSIYPYMNQAHKESSERKLKKLEEQKKLKLNSKEEAKKMFAMHERIAKKYPNGN